MPNTGLRGRRWRRSTVTSRTGPSGVWWDRCISRRHASRPSATSSYGIAEFSDYFTHILPAGPVQGETPAEIIANNRDSGFAVIGTPDDAVAKIEELVEASNGGFGAFLLFDHDWASPAAKLRSYELFAQYVIPHFTGQLAGPIASRDWVTASGSSFVDQAAHAIGKAIETHAAEQQAKQSAGQPQP